MGRKRKKTEEKAKTERRPDELWTDYLVRRLRGEGYNMVNPFDRCIPFLSSHNAIINASTGLMTNESKISIWRVADLIDLLYPKDYKALSKGMLIDEVVEVEQINSDGYLEFSFFDAEREKPYFLNDKARFGGVLSKYISGKNEVKYPLNPQQAIDDIAEYVREVGVVGPLPREKDEQDSKNVAVHSSEFELLSGKVEEILGSVRRLERIASEHPMVMKSEADYLRDLYTRKIIENVDNLRFFEYAGQRIPYVLVNSDEIEGNVGKPFRNLYFVARDKATEEWQQQIVAHHESLCVRIGHDNARRRELDLVKHLGKEKEYKAWRKKIDGGM